MARVIGIDIGGTRIKAGLVGEDLEVLAQDVVWLEPQHKTEDGLIDQLARACREALASGDVSAIGVGIAGVVDTRRGVLGRSPNFPALRDFALRERLQTRLGVPVLVDNDANCVVAGEFAKGAVAQRLAERGLRDLLGFTLGTGVGGGIVLGGRIWHGARGMAGELGHVCVVPDGPLCGCGAHGCLEMYAGSVGLRAGCRAHPVAGVDTESPDLPRLLSEAARAGDATAAGHFAAAGRAFGQALGGFLNTLDIKTVLIGGGLSPSWDLMEPSARDELERRAFPEIAEGVEFVTSSLGEQAGIVGAAMLGFPSNDPPR